MSVQHLAPDAMFSSQSQGRAFSEEPHPFPGPFQRDRDRVWHSAALANKLKESSEDLLTLSRHQFALLSDRSPLESWLEKSLKILRREQTGSRELETWHKSEGKR